MFQRDKLEYQAIPLPERDPMSDEEMMVAASAFYDEMKQRHTVRDYSTRPAKRSIIETCIKAAGTAPSGANHQP